VSKSSTTTQRAVTRQRGPHRGAIRAKPFLSSLAAADAGGGPSPWARWLSRYQNINRARIRRDTSPMDGPEEGREHGCATVAISDAGCCGQPANESGRVNAPCLGKRIALRLRPVPG